ncbi:arylesterase [Sphingomonas aracearum]|uniref:Arylesterase n=1 Tax=Sphingomonas aracearum TaxID=2283317 RepID=A0A369VUS5_9SPHN|nr:arylesterase [Sphingomonas aracearum]RDE06126.1 arylesterase [Sphingomonas aracearum]
MPISSSPYVLAIGDSLTAGYGLPASASFAARLQHLLRHQDPGATVRNAGVSGDTTEGGLRRLPRLLASLTRKPDLAIVELGANDLLRGIPPERTRANLDAILAQLGACGIPVLLATFEVPRFLSALAAGYDGMYAALAAKHGAALAPFFPQGVLGHPELVLRDRLHPNARAIELVAEGFLPAVTAALSRGRAEAA